MEKLIVFLLFLSLKIVPSSQPGTSSAAGAMDIDTQPATGVNRVQVNIKCSDGIYENISNKFKESPFIQANIGYNTDERTITVELKYRKFELKDDVLEEQEPKLFKKEDIKLADDYLNEKLDVFKIDAADAKKILAVLFSINYEIIDSKLLVPLVFSMNVQDFVISFPYHKDLLNNQDLLKKYLSENKNNLIKKGILAYIKENSFTIPPNRRLEFIKFKFITSDGDIIYETFGDLYKYTYIINSLGGVKVTFKGGGPNMGLSPSGNKFVIVSGNKIYVIDSKNGRIINSIQFNHGIAPRITFSPNGDKCAIYDLENHNLIIINVNDGSVFKDFGKKQIDAGIWALSDEGKIIFKGNDYNVYLLNTDGSLNQLKIDDDFGITNLTWVSNNVISYISELKNSDDVMRYGNYIEYDLNENKIKNGRKLKEGIRTFIFLPALEAYAEPGFTGNFDKVYDFKDNSLLLNLNFPNERFISVSPNFQYVLTKNDADVVAVYQLMFKPEIVGSKGIITTENVPLDVLQLIIFVLQNKTLEEAKTEVEILKTMKSCNTDIEMEDVG